jgi:hypothetical protein
VAVHPAGQSFGVLGRHVRALQQDRRLGAMVGVHRHSRRGVDTCIDLD